MMLGQHQEATVLALGNGDAGAQAGEALLLHLRQFLAQEER
jgi:hypothetical protein